MVPYRNLTTAVNPASVHHAPARKVERWDIVAWQISIFTHQKCVEHVLEAKSISYVCRLDLGLMKRCMRCWKHRRIAPSSLWSPSSTTATGVGPDPTGETLSTMSTHAVRSRTPIHPILDFSQWTLPKGHDMCYDTIDKSGLCDGVHPALVTYQFEPAANGTLACTDCSGEDLMDEQRSDEEVACHCKVIGQSSQCEKWPNSK